MSVVTILSVVIAVINAVVSVLNVKQAKVNVKNARRISHIHLIDEGAKTARSRAQGQLRLNRAQARMLLMFYEMLREISLTLDDLVRMQQRDDGDNEGGDGDVSR